MPEYKKKEEGVKDQLGQKLSARSGREPGLERECTTKKKGKKGRECQGGESRSKLATDSVFQTWVQKPKKGRAKNVAPLDKVDGLWKWRTQRNKKEEGDMTMNQKKKKSRKRTVSTTTKIRIGSGVGSTGEAV